MSEKLECVVSEPKGKATATVIWMHGLGADGNDFVPVVPALGLPESMAVRFIFPHAPVREVTVNGGMPMRAWFDVYQMGARRDINTQDLLNVSQSVMDLIASEEQKGIPAERIFLFGFSQGGAVGYQTALTYPRRLAGLAAMSTYRIDADKPASQAVDANRDLPIRVNHGDWDSVVPAALGREAFDSLIAQNLNAEWLSYPMDHEVCLPQIQDLGKWIIEVLEK